MMNWKVVLLLVVLADFGLYSGWVLLESGYMGIWYAGMANPAAGQILFDLVIACLLACVWMVHDARQQGRNPWPYVAITLCAGSFGPLLYLLRREWGTNRAAASAA